MRLVVDTNIIISSILKDGISRKIITNYNFDLITPAYTLTEILKYKDEICKKAKLNSEEFQTILNLLFKYIKIIKPELYLNNMNKASSLIKDIKDFPFLACAISQNCPIWSEDKGFKRQNTILVLNTSEIKRDLLSREKF